MTTRRVRCGVGLLFGLILAATLPMTGILSDANASEDVTCPFCKLVQESRHVICIHCARTLRHPDQERLWLDAPYVRDFPTLDDKPRLDAELGEQGLVREVTTFTSGDRYEVVPNGKILNLSGRITGYGTTKSVDFKGTITPTHDDGGRISRLEIVALAKAKPVKHVYRRLDYKYGSDGLLSEIECATWVYRKAGDRQKRPAEWTKHYKVGIALQYSDGELARIESSYRDGKRDLRGNPEYGEPRVTVDEFGSGG